jgi:nicotinamidase-related amidase
MKPALLVLDMQERFRESADPEAAKSWDDAIEAINAAIGAFEKLRLPVYCVEHEDPNTDLLPGSCGFDTDRRIRLRPDVPRMRKRKSSAFAGTDLGERMTSAGADTLIVSGYCAEWCVLTTLRASESEGFRAIALADGIASAHPERVPFVLEINASIDSGALASILP